MRVVLFARVSTNIQDYDRQINELTRLAKRNGWDIAASFTEKVSGAKKNSERTELLRMVEYVEANNIDKVVVTETLTEDGKVNPMSQFLITILAEVARMERKTIKERMDSGYQNFRANGGLVGRKQGYRKSEEKMKEEYAEEIRLLKKRYSLRNVSKITHTSINTLRKLSIIFVK